MYAAMPSGARPVRRRAKKSRFQRISGNATATVIVLRTSGLSAHNPSEVARSATSENQRKFAGP